MPGQVEGDHPVVLKDGAVIEQGTVLATVAAGGVQAQQGNALARFLDIQAVGLAQQLEAQVAADDGFDMDAHSDSSVWRRVSSSALKYSKLAIKGCWSPSTRRRRCFTRAIRSW